MLGNLVVAIGVILCALGFTAEVIGIAGMSFYQVRRLIPGASPLPMIHAGGWAWVAGVILILASGFF
jgi:hypothetical protein